MHASVVIEFVGMPGAGKTYYHDRVASYLAKQGWRVGADGIFADHQSRLRRASIKFAYVVNELVRSLASCRIAFSALRMGGVAGFGAMLKATSNIVYVRARIRRQSNGFRVLSRDQGCAQGLWSIYWASGPVAARHSILGWKDVREGLPCAFVVIYVDVGKDLAGERTRRRARVTSPLDGSGQRQDDLDFAWETTGKISRELAAAAGEDPLLKLIRIRDCGVAGEDPIASLGVEIEAALQHFMATKDARE